MKTSQDPRHLKRVLAVKDLFAWNYNPEAKLKGKLSVEVIKNIKEIDQEIENSAPSWPINQINKIDLAILRLAVYELLVANSIKEENIIEKGIPFKVIVDESVEIAKEYGSDSSPSFINGVLGEVISRHKLDQKKGE